MMMSAPSTLRNPPFQSLLPQRVPRGVLRCEARKEDASVPTPLIAGGLAQILLAAPAWAADIVNEAATEVQKLDIPSVPSAEEVVNKLPESSGSILDLFTDNPVVVVGLGFLAAVPLVISFFSGGSLGVKSVTASGAVEGLTSDPGTLLIDIRSREDVKEQGSPNLSATKKKAIVLPFTRVVQGEIEQVDNFAESFSKLKQIKPESSIIILDASGKEAAGAAKVLAKLVGRVYYVQGGAAAWQESGELWKEPGKNLLNLDNLAEDFKNQPTLTKAGVAVGAVGVAAAVLFQEAGVVLELAGLAAAGALVLPGFLRGNGGDSAASGGTLKRQVKDFVKDSEKEAKKVGGKVERESGKAARQLGSKADEATGSDLGARAGRAAKQVGRKVEEAADSDLGSRVERTAEKAGSKLEKAANNVQAAVKDAAKDPEKAVEKTGDKAEKASKKAGSIAEEGAEKVEAAAGSAKEWIANWEKEQTK